MVSEDFCEPSFQRGVQSFRRFLVFWSKNRFLKKGMVAIPFFNFCAGGCWRMLLLGDEKGVAKKNLQNTGFFGHPLS